MASLAFYLSLCVLPLFVFREFSEALDPNLFEFAAANSLNMAIANDTDPPSPGEFSHYVLALQWPISICRQANGRLCKTPIPRRFILKGLWPTRRNGESLVYCISRDLISKSLTDYGDANVNLWAREWTKHGTCSGLTQAEYFQTAVDLHQKVDVQKKLASLGYRPSPTARYDPSTIVSDFKKEYGIGIKIACASDYSAQEMLAQIHFQVNRDRETLESITGPSNLCQTTHIGFPEDYNSL